MGFLMKSTQVYDLPTRLFHWIFAGLFIGAFFIAKTYDDDSATYPYHMMLGLTLGWAVILRFIWGLLGSRYAKFSSFALKPGRLVSYFFNIFTSKTKLEAGHNPASSWAAIAMMVLALALAVTGFLMAQDYHKDVLEDFHEIFANTFVIIAIFHVIGVVFHSFRHKDLIALSMIHGRKKFIDKKEGINKSYLSIAIVFLFLLGLFILNLNLNYDTQTRSLSFFGQNLQLGEAEETE